MCFFFQISFVDTSENEWADGYEPVRWGTLPLPDCYTSVYKLMSKVLL